MARLIIISVFLVFVFSSTFFYGNIEELLLITGTIKYPQLFLTDINLNFFVFLNFLFIFILGIGFYYLPQLNFLTYFQKTTILQKITNKFSTTNFEIKDFTPFIIFLLLIVIIYSFNGLAITSLKLKFSLRWEFVTLFFAMTLIVFSLLIKDNKIIIFLIAIFAAFTFINIKLHWILLILSPLIYFANQNTNSFKFYAFLIALIFAFFLTGITYFIIANNFATDTLSAFTMQSITFEQVLRYRLLDKFMLYITLFAVITIGITKTNISKKFILSESNYKFLKIISNLFLILAVISIVVNKIGFYAEYISMFFFALGILIYNKNLSISPNIIMLFGIIPITHYATTFFFQKYQLFAEFNNFAMGFSMLILFAIIIDFYKKSDISFEVKK